MRALAHHVTAARACHTRLAELRLDTARCAVANFLGIKPPELMTLPVILNVVLIGFRGESGLNVSEAALRPWFEQLQSSLPHAVMPASASSGRQHEAPSSTAVQYRYFKQLHVMPPAVTSRVEELIDGWLRPDQLTLGSSLPTPSTASGPLQLSAPRMASLLSSLLASLELPGFSLVVLNPQRRVAGGRTCGLHASKSPSW